MLPTPKGEDMKLERKMQVLHYAEAAAADGKSSAMRKEEDEGLWTVESLRGRLLAERAASKAAKEDEQLMASKLKELEVQLRSETKAMKKYEKKLRFLKKKLQSLSVSQILEDSDESERFSSPEASDSSCISSVASTEEPQREARRQNTIKTTDSSCSQQEENPKTHILPPCQDSHGSPNELHANEQDPFHEVSQMYDKSANPDKNCPGWKTQMENDDREEEDNSMALVPINIPSEFEGKEQSTEKDEMKISSESVRDLLGTLKNIREEIKSTMQRRQSNRQMIRTR